MKRKTLVSSVWTGTCLALGIVMYALMFGDRVYAGNDIIVYLVSGETLIIDQPAKLNIIPEPFRLQESMTGETVESKPTESKDIAAGAWTVESGRATVRLITEGQINARVMKSAGDTVLAFTSLLLVFALWFVGILHLFLKPA